MTMESKTDLIAKARTALELNLPLTVEILHSFIRNEVHKFGFTRAVLNLSGGIDSALSAYLAAGALGPENVLALLLPYRASNPDSRSDAETVVEALGISAKLLDITPLGRSLLCRICRYGREAARQRDGAGAHDRPLRPVSRVR